MRLDPRIAQRLIWAVTAVTLVGVPVFPQNLLVNPDAETGTIAGWRDPDGFWGSAAVTWQMIGTVGTGRLWLSIDGGVNFTAVDSNISCADGHYDWNVPVVDQAQRQCVLKMAWDGGEAVSGVFGIVTDPTFLRPHRHATIAGRTTGTPINRSGRIARLLDGRSAGSLMLAPRTAGLIVLPHAATARTASKSVWMR